MTINEEVFKAAVDCAEQLGSWAATLPGCALSKDVECKDPMCGRCLSFRLCGKYFEAMKAAGIERPGSPCGRPVTE